MLQEPQYPAAFHWLLHRNTQPIRNPSWHQISTDSRQGSKSAASWSNCSISLLLQRNKCTHYEQIADFKNDSEVKQILQSERTHTAYRHTA